MSLGVLLIVLAGALLHASWNLLIKAGRDTRVATAGVYIGAGGLAAVTLAFLPPLPPAGWPYLAASTGIEVLYGVVLAAAYRLGDLSLAYPLMRGTAPLLVAIGSVALLGQPLSHAVWCGVVLVSFGIWVMVLDARPQGHSLAAVRLALLNAVVIAAYTTIDGAGVRASGEPLSYGAWIFVLTGLPWLLWSALRSRVQLRAEFRRVLALGIVGGACSLVSYVAALWAMTRAPVAAVAAVRETSILFGTVLGVLVLRERLTAARALAAASIVVGVWFIRGG
jgi:drug/metabolite transporter (DMT)-like permease